MKHIEFSGIPGAGKSVLADHAPCTKAQLTALQDALSRYLRKDGSDRLCKWAASLLPSSRARALYKRSRDFLPRQCDFVTANKDLLETVYASPAFRSDDPTDRSLLLTRFMELTSQYQATCAAQTTGSTVVFDEGFIQRGVSVFVTTDAGLEVDEEPIRNYARAIPLPCAIMQVGASLEHCESRLNARGWPTRLKDSSPNDRRRFLESCGRYFSIVEPVLAERGTRLLTVKNDGTIEQGLQRLEEALAPLEL